jgi:hypothetical protein
MHSARGDEARRSIWLVDVPLAQTHDLRAVSKLVNWFLTKSSLKCRLQVFWRIYAQNSTLIRVIPAAEKAHLIPSALVTSSSPFSYGSVEIRRTILTRLRNHTPVANCMLGCKLGNRKINTVRTAAFHSSLTVRECPRAEVTIQFCTRHIGKEAGNVELSQ